MNNYSMVQRLLDNPLAKLGLICLSACIAIATCHDIANPDLTDNSMVVINECTTLECQNETEKACAVKIREQVKTCGTSYNETGKLCGAKWEQVAWTYYDGDCKNILTGGGWVCICDNKEVYGTEQVYIYTCTCHNCPTT